MRRKSSNFIEMYTDKLILAIFAIACIWLLVFNVFSGSSSIEYDNKKFGPDQIDNYIEAQSRELEEKLSMEPDGQRGYESKLDTYQALLNSAIKGVDSGLFLPLPNYGTRVVYGDRVYQVPEIGQVNNVAVQLVRGVAYNPLYEPDTNNDRPENELLDVDLITVQGTFNIMDLVTRFHECFAGKSVNEQWRDKELAKPILAAIQLDRQQMAKDGSWPNEWERVTRPKVDSLRDTLEIPENVSELQLGVEILMVQFDRPEIKIGLLQPEVYDFEIPTESWLPPSLFQKRQEHLEKLRLEEERSIREIEKRERSSDRERAGEGRERSSRTRDTGMTATRGGGAPTRGGPGGDARTRRTTPRRTTKPEKEKPRRTPARPDLERPVREDTLDTIPDEEEQFEEIRLHEDTDFEEMVRPLVFWSHDETAEPGRTYRYRIRIGVFNPIAGTDWFGDENQQLKNQVILWSNYSDVTKPVTVPKKLYFFPEQIRESDKTLTVDIRKYLLGKWYNHSFMVKPGESIGQVVNLQKENVLDEYAPPSIDYRTGAILLDVVDVSDWFGPTALRQRNYSDILYTPDGISIEHLPFQERYWPSELRKKRDEIDKKQSEQATEIFSPRGIRRTPATRGPGGGRRMPPTRGRPPMPGMLDR